jgi:acyl carrier protein
MSDKILDQVAALVAQTLDMNRDEIGPDSSMSNILSWDSVGHMNICLAMEEQFGKVFDPDTVATATSVKSLAALVANNSR